VPAKLKKTNIKLKSNRNKTAFYFGRRTVEPTKAKKNAKTAA